MRSFHDKNEVGPAKLSLSFEMRTQLQVLNARSNYNALVLCGFRACYDDLNYFFNLSYFTFWVFQSISIQKTKQNYSLNLYSAQPSFIFFSHHQYQFKRLSFLHHILVGNGKHCTQHILKLFQPFKRLQSEKCSGQQCFPFLTVRVQKETFLSNQQMHLT